jgi:ketosteroid isomerase-like protein
MSQANVESIRRGWEAWLREDMDALVSLWDPDVIWDTSHFRDWPESSYYGVEGVRKFLTEWLEVWGEYKIDVEEVRSAPDGRVVSLFTHRGRGQQSGVPMELPMAQIATLRDGKVIRFENYDDRSEALEAAGLSE